MDMRQNSLESLHKLRELVSTVSVVCVCVYRKRFVLEEDRDGRQSDRGRARVIRGRTVLPLT